MAKKETIKIGIIGAGFARSTQIPGFVYCTGARVQAIASAHREHAESVAREFGIEHVADDWREIIASKEIDLVSIVTPPSLHMEMALAALDAGKAVLCEKPMAMNADEADRMRRAAREKGAFALIDHELRFLAGRRRMRELLRRGEIGRVLHAKHIFRTDSRADPERPWDWWSDEGAGGGALGAIGSHAIDAFRWLLGSEVSQVFCHLSTHFRERTKRETGERLPVTTDDEANLLLRFNDSELVQSATATASMSMVESGGVENTLQVFGTNGALMVERDGQLFQSSASEGVWRQVETDSGELAPGMIEGGWSRGFTAFAQLIIRALQEGHSTVEDAATFEDGYRIQLVLDAARRSHKSGCWSSIG
ncbi:MAG TPA: Gfo/Idh/MocA family oxidoreductase [Pyrinomonadaceae bacterium]